MRVTGVRTATSDAGKVTRLFGGFGLVLLAAGCGVLAPLTAPEPPPVIESAAMPAAWSAAAPGIATAAGELAHWWTVLRDPPLDALIAQALADAPDLRIARARVHEARALLAVADAGRLPTLQATGSATHTGGDGTSGQGGANVSTLPSLGGGTATNTTTAGTQLRAGFDASWELDLFGGTGWAVEAAAADLAAAEEALHDARVTLAAEVAETYVELRQQQNQQAIARRNLATQLEILQIVEWRVKAGLTTELDLEQARTNVAQTRAGLPPLEKAEAQARHRLAVLVGRFPESLAGELAGPRPLPAVPTAIATGIPANLLTRRPDLRKAERTLAAETARVGVKTAALYPDLTLSGSLVLQAGGLALSGGTLLGTLAASLTQPLFDGGSRRAALAAQEAVQERAVAEYGKALLAACQDVENALVALETGQRRAEGLGEAVAAARRAATLARSRYRAGVTDFQTVLDADRTQLGTEDALATAEAAVLMAVVQLYKALGGGWEPEPPRPGGHR